MSSVLTVAVIVLLVGMIGIAYWLMQINTQIEWLREKIQNEIDKPTLYRDPAEIARLKTWTYKLIPQTLKDINEKLEEIEDGLSGKSAD
jgi:hypothetical protein